MTEQVYAHFIGVGGAGMSGIAHVLHERGVAVSGSDLKLSRYARHLADEGVRVSIGHDASNLGDPEIVVVSSAIPEANPELAEARRRGIPVWQRAKMLAHLAGEQKTIAVAGTHGKTSTSSMIAQMLAEMGEDPTFLIGGELNDMGANARCGRGRWYVVEADESDGSFLHLSPYVAVVTNVEADHLDHYSGIEEVRETFAAFLSNVEAQGVAVLCADAPGLLELAAACPARVVTYGRAPQADVRLVALAQDGLGHRFEVSLPGGGSAEGRISLPGEHMALNATAAVAVAHALGLDPVRAAAALALFTGVRRRFELVGEVDGITVVDDYAHHPTEVAATLAGARKAGFERIWVVFQPHRYSRTAALGRDFGSVFEDADRVVLMDVYGAGETPIPGVSGKTLVDAVLQQRPRSRVAYFPHRADVEPYVTSNARAGDLVMTMGAGDVTAIGGDLVRALVARRA
ncbi:MAG TPA: UDP-N-acetylmuramate--L-alanine ligase [Coriobacteriia bacterium]